ncbi:MAG TPA: DUF1614 domain-containing protein [Acidimicrobiales bacterium]|nr:DUF1614 domain-containing protein [Acidimicrobiales bacterium]
MNSSDDTGQRRSADDGGPFGYWPLAGPSLLALLLVGLAVILFVNLAGYAYERIGISTGWFDAILIGSLLGSRINIPVWKFPGQARVESEQVVVFGVLYRIPVRRTDSSILAVNVGGAIIPTSVSVYLIVHDHIWQHSLIAMACVAVVVFLVARPVEGVGIVTPSLVPPAAAAVAALVIGKPHVAALAYICGTLGTLIGADLMNLWRVRRLGAPEASIGGAGTFDGVFLSGLLAVLLASL